MTGRSLASPAEVFHKIRIDGYASKYSAWFDGSGFLIDCERIDRLGRSFPCTDAEMSKLQHGPWSAKQHARF